MRTIFISRKMWLPASPLFHIKGFIYPSSNSLNTNTKVISLKAKHLVVIKGKEHRFMYLFPSKQLQWLAVYGSSKERRNTRASKCLVNFLLLAFYLTKPYFEVAIILNMPLFTCFNNIYPFVVLYVIFKDFNFFLVSVNQFWNCTRLVVGVFLPN